MPLTRYGVCYDLRETPFVASYGEMEFHVNVRASELAAVQLYQMIENRGFLVRVREEWFECPGDLAFRGRLSSAGDSLVPSAPSTEPLLG